MVASKRKLPEQDFKIELLLIVRKLLLKAKAENELIPLGRIQTKKREL
jgi:hypothetical protein